MSRLRPFLIPSAALAVACLMLSGCAARTAFNRPGAWVEAPGGGAVGYDVRAETAGRHDLYHGRGITGARPDGGVIATHAATRMNKPLTSRHGGSGSGSNGARGSSATPGGA